MTEIRDERCCMCPNAGEPMRYVCPAGQMKPEATPCDFVIVYMDNEDRAVIVHADKHCMDALPYKAQVRHADGQWWPLSLVPYRATFDEAQHDLNVLARERGWKRIGGN